MCVLKLRECETLTYHVALGGQLVHQLRKGLIEHHVELGVEALGGWVSECSVLRGFVGRWIPGKNTTEAMLVMPCQLTSYFWGCDPRAVSCQTG